MMDPLWSETCWRTFKYFIILIVSTNYILCMSWIIKCLIFKREVRGGRFFKEVGKYVPDYTASYPGLQQFCGHPSYEYQIPQQETDISTIYRHVTCFCWSMSLQFIHPYITAQLLHYEKRTATNSKCHITWPTCVAIEAIDLSTI